MVVTLYHRYTQFPRNVHLSHRRIATFSAPYKYTYLLRSSLLILVHKYLWQFYL